MALEEVLTTASTIVCTHAMPPSPPIGGATLVIPGARALQVNNVPVLLMPVVPVTVGGACLVPANPPTTRPCTGVATVTKGAAAKLLVNGVPVLLAGSFDAKTFGAPTATFNVDPKQLKLRTEPGAV